jgi:hypothetical protein
MMSWWSEKNNLLLSRSMATRPAYFINEHRIQRTRDLGIKCEDLKGTLVLGTATVSNDTWSGTIAGLASYGRSLTPEEVASHFHAWTANSPAGLKESLHASSLYLFNEGSGSVANDFVSGRRSITIPKDYAILRKRFLQPFWEESPRS